MKKSHEGKRSIFLSALLAQAVWGMSSVILLLVFCTVACSTEDPERITGPLALCALYLSSMAGGIAAVRLSGDGIVSGMLSGVITGLLVCGISLLPLPPSTATRFTFLPESARNTAGAPSTSFTFFATSVIFSLILSQCLTQRTIIAITTLLDLSRT